MSEHRLKKNTILQGKSHQYLIEKVLGQGCSGITYLASLKTVGVLEVTNTNKVAIKELFVRGINGRSNAIVTCSSKEGYDSYKKNFIHETLCLCTLKHPNIVKTIELFETNNTVYHVMEFINGGSLDDYIAKNNGMKESEAVRIVKQIGSALSFMHSRRMLHFDLKPSNIMLNDMGDAILVDFGLSKQYNEKGKSESTTIQIGAGTPGYAPIEQVCPDEWSSAIDVYALGGTMFKMLTGIRPPEASDILNNGFPFDELQEHNVSERISFSIAKAMAPKRKDRFSSVAEFINSFDGATTLLDIEVATKDRKTSSDNKGTLFIVRPNTSEVLLEFTPAFHPFLGGNYICSVSQGRGVNVNIKLQQYRNKLTLSYLLNECEYQNFLNDLSDLNLTCREVEVPYRMETSEEPGRLSITLFDNNGRKYNTFWICGWHSEYGNVKGNLHDIEGKVRKIVPMLQKYLDFYEIIRPITKFVFS